MAVTVAPPPAAWLEQRDLAENLPGAQRRNGHGAGLPRYRDLGAALGDQVEPVALIALGHDHGPRGVALFSQAPGQLPEHLLG